MNRKLKHRVAMEAALRDALRLKQLDVHYQPFVNFCAQSRGPRGSHPLAPSGTWDDTGGPVHSGRRRNGLDRAHGQLRAAPYASDHERMAQAGVSLVPMSLNVAPAQLQRGEFQSTISTLLKTHGIDPELLQLEMTERAVFDSTLPRGEPPGHDGAPARSRDQNCHR